MSRKPTRTTRKPAAACVLAASVLLCAGCSGGASVGAGNDSPTAQKAVKFAQCMRGNGVSRFPDPSASGKVTIDGIANGSSIDTSSPAFRHALGTCKSLEPTGFTGSRRNPEQQAAALKFAQCVRENGVTDFPDPIEGQPLVDTNRIPSAAQPGGMSILKTAMHKCSDFAAAAGVSR